MTLKHLRRKIDQIDKKLLRLLNERALLALRVGEVKKRQLRPVFDARREEAVLRRLTRANSGPLSQASIRRIFREVLRHSRRIQN